MREGDRFILPFGGAISKLESVFSLERDRSSQSTGGYTHLQVAAAAGGGVLQHPDLKLFEANPQNPVSGRPAKGTEAVPAREGLTPIRSSHRRARHILVNVHCFVAVASVR